MSDPQKAQSPGGAGLSAYRNADPCIFAEQSDERKREATLVAKFALRGHAVHRIAEGGFLVCRHGYVKHCQDITALEAFCRKVGAA